MAVLTEVTADHPVLLGQDELMTRLPTVGRCMADPVRALAAEWAEAAVGRDPATAPGLAEAAAVMWTRALKFDAADPHWPDRDRFVMSARHGGTLLHALQYLTGHDPQERAASEIEARFDTPGQGLGLAVGMALAERILAARFGKSLVDHRTWVIACDACLMGGLSHEAAGLAGHLRLEKLTVLYHDDEAAREAASGDVLKRFAACGWAVQRVDGCEEAEIASALSFAQRSKKPTLLAVQALAIPAGRGGAAAPRPFDPSDDLAARWQRAGARGTAARRAWLKRLARHPQRGEFERVMSGRLPETWHDALAAAKASLAMTRPPLATDAASRQILAALAPVVPELIGGLAEFGGTVDPLRGAGTVTAGSYGGRTVLYGHREHAMAASGTGLALHGGVVPSAASSLSGSDAMRPALRLAATLRQRVIHVLSESAAGEQGGAHLAGLRAMPGLFLFRPADAIEAAECWELALRRADGPSLIVLGRQAVSLRGAQTVGAENRCARGGYVVAEAEGPRQATLVASGSDIVGAMSARQALAARGVAVAVVSLVCWELFAQADGAYQERVLGGAPRFGLEAAGGFGWDRWLGAGGQFLDLLETEPGPVTEAIVARVLKRVSS